jgi:hypothetical protein
VAKVAGAIAGFIGGAIAGAVLGAIGTAITPFRAIADFVMHRNRKNAPKTQLLANSATRYPGVLYNPSQRTNIMGIPMDTGRSGAEMLAEQYGIPRSLWGTHLRAFNDPTLGTLTAHANFSGKLVMVGHGDPNGDLETVGHGAPGAHEWLVGQDNENRNGIRETLAGRGLNWGSVTSIDMSICQGVTLATNLQATLALPANNNDIITRVSSSNVTPVGNLSGMGVIRDGSSSIFGQVLHWLTLGLFSTADIESAPAAGGRNSNQNNGTWHTIRS